MHTVFQALSDLGEVLDALEAERHELAGLEGARHPLVRRVEEPLAEAAEVDVDLQRANANGGPSAKIKVI